jgi:hypothetical protein
VSSVGRKCQITEEAGARHHQADLDALGIGRNVDGD